jgi:hypothetical protein
MLRLLQRFELRPQILRRIGPVAAVLPTLALMGFGGSVVAHVVMASCPTVIQRIEFGGVAGPLECSANGTKTIVVARRTSLVLSSMTVNAVKTRTTHELSDVVDGTTISHATAKGTFVVVTIRVANHTHMPQLFDPDSQAELEIKSNDYSTSTPGTEADSGTDAWDSDIEPGESSTGDVVFDVPTSQASLFPQHAALLLVNFGDFLQASSRVSEFGLIYLGPQSGPG